METAVSKKIELDFTLHHGVNVVLMKFPYDVALEKINDDKFCFTPAYKVFIDFAKELAETKTPDNNIQQN